MAGIVDRPKKADQKDLLAIEKYTKGLIKFIKSSDTPITIGIQGEWGSGKTSLLNTIKEDLCKDDEEYYPIWINTWEYSLLSAPEATLVKIISGLIIQISELTKNNTNKKLKESIDKLGSAVSFVGKMFGGTPGQIAEIAGDAIKSTVNKPQDNSIQTLRNALQEVINETIDNPNTNKKAFIFFVDDLDRLDPTVAVNILELIKNLFDLEKCIFVLAIDYGVVVKGLQSKFGVMTEENEWEFRAFFDKIIQLPFSMPISSYDVSEYLKTQLIRAEYFEKTDLENPEVLKKIVKMVELSVGTNPRSLVRLANSAGLIEDIRGGGEDKNISHEERIIEFALICIQIAYPLIYGLMQKESDFTAWDGEFVDEILKNKQINEDDLNLLIERKVDLFDDEWEQSIWKICQINSFLKQRVYQVSKLFNLIKDNIPKDKDMSDTLKKLLSMSSVTSFGAESIVVRKKRKRVTRKQRFQKTMQAFVEVELKKLYVRGLNNDYVFEFKIKPYQDKGNLCLSVKTNNIEFDLCVWTDYKQINIYINSTNTEDDHIKRVIAWFKDNMSKDFVNMKFDNNTVDGKKIVILKEITLQGTKYSLEQYKKEIKEVFGIFLPKITKVESSTDE